MNKKILIGLSGGVDSAVSAYLLQQAGYDVTAGFMINYLAPEGEYCPTLEDIEVAKQVAEYLEIPFFSFDYRKAYEQKVLDYLYEGYKRGLTPNPDIMCNSEIKFRVFLDEALELGFDAVATGHYAHIDDKDGVFFLKKGVDESKDQSYFLAGLSQDQLAHSIFPLGNLPKSRVREIAREAGLPNATRPDSQGICFVGKVNLSTFLEKKIDHKIGDIIDTNGNKLGEHKGVFYYTVGQRKGLNLGGLKEPLFVVKKDIVTNTLTVGAQKDMQLYSDELFVREMHFLSGEVEFPFSGFAKIRYRQSDQHVRVLKDKNGYRVVFDTPQRAIAPGQICAIYDDAGYLKMSGVIV